MGIKRSKHKQASREGVESAKWAVSYSSKAKKQLEKLPLGIHYIAETLRIALEEFGPIQKEWAHFSALDKKNRIYHCWLKAGHPTYVAVWQATEKGIRLIEITYVGTHEGAPY
ncbi:MAG: hypothetical protein A3E80_03325 [Chlamydiae bacterium RIFCSPHIGHO2_12_FULL_49_9]|nr:MAG: hypothetical protein A3E80_03325 [Chlamydiae bacterium RIFCSPHIGHO2_12_FULL_49_9]